MQKSCRRHLRTQNSSEKTVLPPSIKCRQERLNTDLDRFVHILSFFPPKRIHQDSTAHMSKSTEFKQGYRQSNRSSGDHLHQHPHSMKAYRYFCLLIGLTSSDDDFAVDIRKKILLCQN